MTHSEAATAAAVAVSEATMEAELEPNQVASPDPELDFARQLEDARSLLIQNPLCRPALYRILADCAPARFLLAPLEEHIQQMPEFSKVTQPPFFLIQWLLDVRALDMFELDEQGEDVTPERTIGLTEDEIDDLVADFSFQTNLVGEAVVKEFNPANRLVALLAEMPERYDTYLELLEFLAEKHSYAEVDALLAGRDILMSGRAPDDRPLVASVFIDKLAAVGSIIYDKGWQVTKEGKEFMERTREQT